MSELFGQLYLAQRESDRDELFCHELLSYPPSLSECGKIYYPSSKASLLPCLIETYLPLWRKFSSSQDEVFSHRPPLAPPGAVVYLSPTLGGGGEVGRVSRLFVFYTHRSSYPPFSSLRVAFGFRARFGFCPQLFDPSQPLCFQRLWAFGSGR